MKREFDLNIEKVLENWEVYHAVREIIANALDERALTNTEKIKIFKDESGRWHIRDFGRGLKYTHFTQNENEEKLKCPNSIGKFGVGLKDALATFDRHKIGVEIDSRYGHYTTGQAQKHGFSDLLTLHVYIDEPQNENFDGTDFILDGCTDADIELAKNLFLNYANLKLLDDTTFGQVYQKRNSKGEIFVNGIKVAEEENFLFSYNIASPNATLKKAINRERVNVGRGAYSDRVKDILLKCRSEEVVNEFVHNLDMLSGGEQSDELRWKDVQVYFLQLLSKMDDVMFVTAEQVDEMDGRVREIVEDSGKRKVQVSDTVLDALRRKTYEDDDFKMNTIESVVHEYNQSFQYKFVNVSDLEEDERKNFALMEQVVGQIYTGYSLDKIFISETMRPNGLNETLGVCEDDGESIIILRKVLKNKAEFLGVLAHELVHAKTGYSDCSRNFETALTNELGKLLAKAC